MNLEIYKKTNITVTMNNVIDDYLIKIFSQDSMSDMDKNTINVYYVCRTTNYWYTQGGSRSLYYYFVIPLMKTIIKLGYKEFDEKNASDVKNDINNIESGWKNGIYETPLVSADAPEWSGMQLYSGFVRTLCIILSDIVDNKINHSTNIASVSLKQLWWENGGSRSLRESFIHNLEEILLIISN